MEPLPSIPEEMVLPALQEGASLLTVNRRLARYWGEQYDHDQQRQGKRAWHTPTILPWSAWLDQCWEMALMSGSEGRVRQVPHLLPPPQEQYLWDQVIEGSGGGLLHRPAAALLAGDGWRLLHQWRLSLNESDVMGYHEAETFLSWSEAFTQRCRERGWITSAELPDLLEQWAEGLEWPTRILLTGFDAWTPQQRALLARLAQLGIRIEQVVEAHRVPGDLVRFSLPDSESELRQAALWAREQLGKTPNARIGIIIPTLESLRDAVEEHFTRIFHPLPSFALDGAEESLLFNVSLGIPLDRYPMVRDAFLILSMGRERWPVALYSALLRSPFWRDGLREGGKRAALDGILREEGRHALKPVELFHAARTGCGGAQAAPRLADLLEEVINAWLPTLKRSDHDLPSVWCRRFAALLEKVGWPGERPLTSREHQTLLAWRELLWAFATLDQVTGEMAYETALAHLQRLAGQKLFQPESGAAPIQIMGTLESVGERFDALWITGMTDEAWPAPPAPNPLLPLPWQRRHGLPRASHLRELDFAERMTRGLLHAAPTVVVSHPRREGERGLQGSPLFAHLPEVIPLESIDPANEWITLMRAGAAPEPFQDLCSPPFPDGEKVQGGTALFKAQALCPFQAFARYRLRGKKLEEPTPDLSAPERGILVHRLLERFWREVGSLESLRQISDEGLAEKGRRLSEEVVREKWQEREEVMTPRFAILEQRRLQRLLQRWLEVERKREEPFQVIAREAEYQLAIGGIEIALRMDRLDRLSDGHVAVIDYKTGETTALDVEDPRPSEPQLLLYALAEEARVVAVVLACLRMPKLEFKGVAYKAGLLPGVKGVDGDETGRWEELLTFWQHSLARLGEKFRQGEAQVDPKSRQVCQQCDFPALCRIGEGSGL